MYLSKVIIEIEIVSMIFLLQSLVILTNFIVVQYYMENILY